MPADGEAVGNGESSVERLRAVYDEWARGNFRAGRELFDPEVEFVIGAGFPDSGTYRGREGVVEYMRGFLEPWVRLTIEAEEIIPVGGNVVVAVRQHGVGTGSGAATELRYFQVWTFHEGLVARWENFRDRAAALAAAERRRVPCGERKEEEAR